jgi:DNA-directed RNA polymerase specialized sigma24 family protein
MISAEADRLLAEYLASGDARVLERIVEEFARPIITRIVRSALRGPLARQEGDDAIADTLLGLLKRLHDLRTDPASNPIADLRGYVATSAYHACYERLRHIAPGRYRLRNRIQYLITHDPEFAVQTTTCSWSAGIHAGPSSPLKSAVLEALRESGGTMNIEDLVERVARTKGMDDTFEVPLETADVHAVTTTPETVVEYRLTLRRLWDELRLLAPKQRLALLLNLRDSDGRDLITLFPLTGIATVERIAEVLEMRTEELERIWPDLPLDDLSIAKLLGATRAQVIKLRRLARERLRRRLAKLETVKRDRDRVALSLPMNVASEKRSTYEEMRRVVEGRADAVELELIRGHNEDCVTCTDDLRDLAEFGREIAR